MRFSRKLRFQTAEILLQNMQGTPAFLLESKTSCCEKMEGIFMLTSLGLIFLLGLLMAAICQKIHLPRIIGMLFTGISNTKPRQLS